MVFKNDGKPMEPQYLRVRNRKREDPVDPIRKIFFLQVFAFAVLLMTALLLITHYYENPESSANCFGYTLRGDKKCLDAGCELRLILDHNGTIVDVTMEVDEKANRRQYPQLFRIRRGAKPTDESDSVKKQHFSSPPDFFQGVFKLHPVTSAQRDGRYPRLIRIRRFQGAYGLHDVGQRRRVQRFWEVLHKAAPFEDDLPKRVRRDYGEEDNNAFEGTSCKLPAALKTAEILCKMWPGTTTCISYCAYGKTFNEGIRRIHTCVRTEGGWSMEFEECKPFVDCDLRLITPGKLQCIGNKLNESPSCKVSCDRYEDKDELKEQTYRCKTDGSWEPKLPFCAALRGTPLVRAPERIEHKNISYYEPTRKSIQTKN